MEHFTAVLNAAPDGGEPPPMLSYALAGDESKLPRRLRLLALAYFGTGIVGLLVGRLRPVLMDGTTWSLKSFLSAFFPSVNDAGEVGISVESVALAVMILLAATVMIASPERIRNVVRIGSLIVVGLYFIASQLFVIYLQNQAIFDGLRLANVAMSINGSALNALLPLMAIAFLWRPPLRTVAARWSMGVAAILVSVLYLIAQSLWYFGSMDGFQGAVQHIVTALMLVHSLAVAIFVLLGRWMWVMWLSIVMALLRIPSSFASIQWSDELAGLAIPFAAQAFAVVELLVSLVAAACIPFAWWILARSIDEERGRRGRVLADRA